MGFDFSGYRPFVDQFKFQIRPILFSFGVTNLYIWPLFLAFQDIFFGLHPLVVLPWAIIMTDLKDQSTQPVDEKAVMQHHENSGSSQHSHQEMTGHGSEEAMHEPEMDIPVGLKVSSLELREC